MEFKDPVNVIIPTLGHKKPMSHPFRCFASLRYFPFPVKLIVETGGNTWAEAINLGLKEIGPGDVVLMDDDVILGPSTFKGMDLDAADVFGFQLLYPSGFVQHGGGVFQDGIVTHRFINEQPSDESSKPAYVCHVTTSLCYIKRQVIDELKGMTVMPGVQMEDVDFSFRALKSGFKIQYTPGKAIHFGTATKNYFFDMDKGMSEAWKYIANTHLSDPSFVKLISSFPKVQEVVSA